MTNLVAKNKIADYIEQHPEAQTIFLVWLREFESREGQSITRRIEMSPSEHTSTASSPLNNGDYQIEYCINFKLKTTYIVWLGSKEELEAKAQAEFEKMKAVHPDLERSVKVVTVTLSPPPSPGASSTNAVVNLIVAQASEKITAPTAPPYVESKLDFKTNTEYETALNRAIAVFDAQPGSSEFDELAALLPLIKHYEDSKLAMPNLDMLEVVKLKLKEWGMIKPYLSPIIGSEEDLDLFLAGKKTLPDETLTQIYKMLHIGFSY